MPTRQRSAPEVSTGSQTGIVPEDHIMEQTSDTGNPNNGEDDGCQTPPLGWRTTSGGGDDDGYDSSCNSGTSSSDSSIRSKEVYVNKKRSRRSRNRQIVVRR